jgi:hypothetical protein
MNGGDNLEDLRVEQRMLSEFMWLGTEISSRLL